MSSLHHRLFFTVGLILASVFADEVDNSEMESVEDADYLGLLSRRGILDCKQHFELCTGFPKCCGTMQCFWEKGYSLRKKGVCVLCVDREQKCQRDEQCCEPLICQKNGMYSADGLCDLRRPLAATCYRDAQCESSKCEISWIQKLKREAGRCVRKT